MHRPLLCLLLVISLIHRNESQQLQMTQDVEDLSSLTSPEDSSLQLAALQRNITALWSYIYELRGAVTHHLNHLREHQVEMENTIHRLEHQSDSHGDTHAAHTAGHSHSGEDHSHSHGSDSHGHDSHSHGMDSRSHGSDSHSHGSDQHSHSDEHHHHSGEHHGGDDHAHSDEHHSHSHSHESHSHSHSGSDHTTGHEEDHHHDHKDSHESEDDQQQTQQVSEPLVEPVIVPTNVRAHSHYHPTRRSQSGIATSGSSTFQPLNVMGEDSHHHHHSHDRPITRNRTRVVIMPKYSEYDLFEFAVCNLQSNRAIPEDQQQNVMGQISLWQKKIGGPLNIHLRASGFAMGDHHAHHQQMQQEEDNETPAPVVHKHGFHIHSLGDLSNGCQSTGPHYNPKSANHGGPKALVRHVGDLGNIECDDHGIANIVFSDDVASLKGPYSIIGKSMVIHSGEDDYGLGNNEESLRTGNAGTRIACCIIEKVEKLPIRAYKAMKTATQYQNR